MLMIRHIKHFSSTYSVLRNKYNAYECLPLCNNMINLHVLFGKLLEKLLLFFCFCFVLELYRLYLQI